MLDLLQGLSARPDAEVDKWEKEQRLNVFENCGIGNLYKSYTLQSFLADNTKHKEMKEKARLFFSKVLAKSQCNLLMYGNSGTGKTHIAVGLLRELCLIKKPGTDFYFSVAYHTSKDLCARYRRTTLFNAEETYNHFITDVASVDILVIDEVGKGADKNENVIIFDILDKRYQKKLPVILISNMKYQELSELIGEYGLSRLNVNGSLIKIETAGCEDYRQTEGA